MAKWKPYEPTKSELRMVEVIERQIAEIAQLKAEIERLNKEKVPIAVPRKTLNT